MSTVPASLVECQPEADPFDGRRAVLCETPVSPAPTFDVAQFGQVFTPPAIVERMLTLRRNAGRVLDPACGDGAFSSRIPDCVAIELDPAHCPPGALNQDFFAYPETEQFATIIGNPPYVKARDILPQTRFYLRSQLLDGHANLYLHFIEKCVRQLQPGGELILITPRDFLKATGAAQLNTWLHGQGTITDFEDLGDAKIFAGATPNCAIWRFEKGNLTHRLRDGRRMVLAGGQLMFTRGIYSVLFGQVFSVKVGAVSGADEIFTNDELGNMDFVCSHTAQSGETRRMIYLDQEGPLPFLEQFKARLLARRVTRFDENNWWKWGRRHFRSDAPRIYVNHKTRNPQPFFLHPCNNYDGAVLALFPQRTDITRKQLKALAAALNEVDWAEQGFVCDGRFLFSQRALEHTLLPEFFAEFALR
jgi:adenine-specific DNA-methyltransferase